jgi:hypothetical protein
VTDNYIADELELDDEQGPEWDSDFDADRARNTITALRAEVKAAKARGLTPEQQQALEEYDLLREASQTDAERQQAQIEALAEQAGQASTLAAQNLRLQVALEMGLPANLAMRLQGNTHEEVAADAQGLVGLIAPQGFPGMRPIASQGTSAAGAPGLDDQIAAARKAGDTKLTIRLEAQKLATLRP